MRVRALFLALLLLLSPVAAQAKMLLTGTSDLVQVITADAVSTIYVHASWADITTTALTPGRTNTQITTATTATVVGSPGASTQRQVKILTIRNSHASTSNAITIQHTDGTTVAQILKYTLLAGETIQYTDDDGFKVIDANGQIKSVVVANAGTNLDTSGLLTTTAHNAAFGTAGSADDQVRSIQGVASMTPVQVQSNSANLATESTLGGVLTSTNFAAAFGTAGSADSQVMSVQGIASMTPVAVTGTFWQTTQPVSGTFWQGTQPVSIATNTPSGSVAHDGAGTGVNPLLTGCYSSAAAPSDVSADGDATRDWCLRSGARAVQPTFAGVLQSTGNGTAGTGTPRVTIASDNTAFSVNATLSAETTKVLGVVRTADGSGNLTTSTSQSLDANIKLMNGVAVSMGSGTMGTGVQRVAIASDNDPLTIRGANSNAKINCTNNAFLNMTTATTTEIVALSGSTFVYVCSFSIVSNGATATTVTFVDGTGTNCATSQSARSSGILLTAAANTVGIARGSGEGMILKTSTAGDALCVTSSGAATIGIDISFAQF